MGVVANIEGIVCNRCSVALRQVDFMNHGLPDGWFNLTYEIYLCPECVAAVRAVLAPTNAKVSAIEAINRRRAIVPTPTVRPSRVAIATPRRG